ncbi:MAG TPA: hypothetical protein VD999_02170 [Vitreimonas sp.]|nr:hypothetical protein [Vitreimonas sp.]
MANHSPTTYKYIVVQKDRPFSAARGLALLISGLSIYGMVIPIAFLDLCLYFYQEIYFTLNGIPKIPRSRYVVIQRHRLGKLTLRQKIGCAYCEYGNGVFAWAKAVGNQTEIYSCAIKYSHDYPGQEYQKQFYDSEVFKK